MKRQVLSPLLAALLAWMLAACDSPGAAAFQPYTNAPPPSPDPSEQVFTARPDELAIGSKPFAQLAPETVRSIRITIFRDSQPPDWPDPSKLMDTPDTLTTAISYLQNLHIVDSSANASADAKSLNSMSPGETNLSMDVTTADGITMNYSFHSNVMNAGYTYRYAAPMSLESFYESLPLPEWYAQAGNVLTTAPRYDKDIVFVRRGADAPQGPRAIGQLIARKDDEETVLYEWVSLSPFFFEKSDDRIVFAGYPDGDGQSLETVRYYSMDENGGDLKELEARGRVVSNPLWFDDMLYYVGASSDGSYPRPLNRANADFSRHIKVMDIPGPLVGVSINGGGVYCLSADRKSLLRMPDTVVESFPSPIEQIAYIQASNQYSLTDADGIENKWSPD